MKLIDADILKEAMSKRVVEKRDLNASFYEVINEQPTVDAVEVVRCKDCKHYFPNSEGESRGECLHAMYELFPLPTDYCSWGERKAPEEAEE